MHAADGCGARPCVCATRRVVVKWTRGTPCFLVRLRLGLPSHRSGTTPITSGEIAGIPSRLTRGSLTAGGGSGTCLGGVEEEWWSVLLVLSRG